MRLSFSDECSPYARGPFDSLVALKKTVDKKSWKKNGGYIDGRVMGVGWMDRQAKSKKTIYFQISQKLFDIFPSCFASLKKNFEDIF